MTQSVAGGSVPAGDYPLWVTIVIGIVLPVLGWVSKSWSERLQTRVQERLGLTEAQQRYADGLADRLREVEQRLDRLRHEHHKEMEEVRESYRRQIQTIIDRYESRIADLERQQSRSADDGR